MTAGPGSEVVERLLGSDRRAVEAKQEYLSRRIVLGANHCVIEPVNSSSLVAAAG